MNPELGGIATFERQYGHWVDEQNRQVAELRNALHSCSEDAVLQYLVDSSIKHYLNLFDMKSTAAKADVSYLMSGVWKTGAEHCLSWIGGCHRPSELLTVLIPHLKPLTDPQLSEIRNLKEACQQAEEALSMGMDRRHQTITDTVTSSVGLHGGNRLPRIQAAVDKLDALVRFANQADHLRRETLVQISRILSLRQTAHGLVALGEYCQGLRTVSSLWTSRPRPRI